MKLLRRLHPMGTIISKREENGFIFKKLSFDFLSVIEQQLTFGLGKLAC